MLPLDQSLLVSNMLHTERSFHRLPLLDIRTVLVTVAMYALFYISFCLSVIGTSISLVAALLLSTLAMNMTFTAWHEASHRLISRNKSLNDLFGILGSLPLGFPGYYGRKREHLVHHRYEADPINDPVFPRLQLSLYEYILSAFIPFGKLNPLTNTRAYEISKKSTMPIKNFELLVDKVLLSFSVIMMLFFAVVDIKAFLVIFFIPRIIIFFCHAYYICFLSHKPSIIGDASYVLYHCFSSSLLIRFLTLNQSLHGYHHKFPNKPWYMYSLIPTEGIVDK